MFDYLHLTAAGYEKVFEPVYELLNQLLTEGEPEPDLDKILQDWSHWKGLCIIIVIVYFNQDSFWVIIV